MLRSYNNKFGLTLFSFKLLIVIHSSMPFIQDWVIWTDWSREDDSINRYNWVSSVYRQRQRKSFCLPSSCDWIFDWYIFPNHSTFWPYLSIWPGKKGGHFWRHKKYVLEDFWWGNFLNTYFGHYLRILNVKIKICYIHFKITKLNWTTKNYTQLHVTVNYANKS